VRTIRTECRIAYTAGDTVDRHRRQRWCVEATDRPTQASVHLNATLVSSDDQYDSRTVATVDVCMHHSSLISSTVHDETHISYMLGFE